MSFRPALMKIGCLRFGRACLRLTCFSAHGVAVH